MIKLKNMKHSDWARSWSRVNLFLFKKKTKKQTKEHTVTEAKNRKRKKKHVKEHEIFRKGGQSENKVTKSSVSHPIPLQFFSNLESREVFQSCRKLAEDWPKYINGGNIHTGEPTFFIGCKQNYIFCAHSLAIPGLLIGTNIKHSILITD